MNIRFTLIILFFYSSIYSQYGSIEINTGGFSFIPIFTSEKPHIILRAGTNNKKRFSVNLLNLTSISGLNPSNLSLISRYRIVNKEKIKIDIGIHLPAFRVDENQEYKSRIVQESNIIYSINSKTKLSLLYIHGEGRNFNFNVNFLTLNFQKTLNKFMLNSQLYVLNIDDIISGNNSLVNNCEIPCVELWGECYDVAGTYILDLSNQGLLDFEWAYQLQIDYSGDSLYNTIVKPYRLWSRYSNENLEARFGLQKIIFGPTQILRPLSWFDTFDVKDPSGETNPDQVIMSPGIRDLRSLFTGPPSEKATSFTAFPEENTEMFAWPPLVSLGNEVTVPDVGDSIWSSLS